MISLVDLLHSGLAAVVGALLAPFSGLAPIYGLLFVSGICGVLLLLVYGKVSNQQAIKKIKTAIHAEILECVIFRHDVRLCLGAQARLFRNAFLYFCYALPPLVILCVPCLLLLAQLNLRFESRPFSTGETGLLTVKLDSPAQLYDLKLDAPGDIELAGPVRVPTTQEVIWRFTLKDAAKQNLDVTLSLKGATYPLALAVGKRSGAEYVTQAFYASTFWRLLYPLGGLKSVPEFAGSPVESINISYPAARYSLLGFNLNWLVIFFLVSLASGLVAGRYFKVEI